MTAYFMSPLRPLTSHCLLDISTRTPHTCLNGNIPKIEFLLFPLKPLPSLTPLVFSISVNALLIFPVTAKNLEIIHSSSLSLNPNPIHQQILPFLSPKLISNLPTSSRPRAPWLDPCQSLLTGLFPLHPCTATPIFPKADFSKIKSCHSPVQHSSAHSHHTRNNTPAPYSTRVCAHGRPLLHHLLPSSMLSSALPQHVLFAAPQCPFSPPLHSMHLLFLCIPALRQPHRSLPRPNLKLAFPVSSLFFPPLHLLQCVIIFIYLPPQPPTSRTEVPWRQRLQPSCPPFYPQQLAPGKEGIQ